MMPEPMSWIRTLYDYSNGVHIRRESDRCIKACAKAKYENGVWTCPLFAVGVDRVSVVTDGGLMCRMFERREQ